jgi:hypothetical protein
MRLLTVEHMRGSSVSTEHRERRHMVADAEEDERWWGVEAIQLAGLRVDEEDDVVQLRDILWWCGAASR